MDLPLHPVLVHLPMALAVVVPLIAVGTWLAWYRGFLPARSWLVVVALQALLVGGGAVSMESGEDDEERVERVVAEQRIEAHEDAATAFMVGAGIVLGLSVLAGGVMFRNEALGRVLAGVATLGTLAVLGLGVRVGHMGGELVYKYGAASAHTPAGAGQPAGSGEGPAVSQRGEHDDDDD